MNERAHYLQQIWSPYPSILRGSLILFGKVSEIDPVHTQISLLRYTTEGRVEQRFASRYLMQGSQISAAQVLKIGDFVGVDRDSQVILLSPNLGDFEPKRDFSFVVDWAKYMQIIRHFFSEYGFLEVQTPLLVPCPGTEPSLDVFSTDLILGQRRTKYFLPTSPEIHLKKLLAQGFEKVFEMTSSFRNGEVTEKHQPEFKILEFYRAFDDLNSIKSDVNQLVRFLCSQLGVEPPASVVSYSVPELFKIYCGFELLPATNIYDLKKLAESLNVDVRSATSIDDYFFLIFIEKIESQLPTKQLIFVDKYPPYQAALARVGNDGWAERFEFYWKGFELGNAFYELNDPRIQRLRSQEDLQKKQEMKKDEINLDEDFFRALEGGLPPSAGIAIGLERLFMALTDKKKIEDVMCFPKS